MSIMTFITISAVLLPIRYECTMLDVYTCVQSCVTLNYYLHVYVKVGRLTWFTLHSTCKGWLGYEWVSLTHAHRLICKQKPHKQL